MQLIQAPLQMINAEFPKYAELGQFKIYAQKLNLDWNRQIRRWQCL